MLNRTAIAEQFDSEYWRGFWQRFLRRLTSHSMDLYAFADYISQHRVTGRHDGGVQFVNINDIVGSVGRVRDFDRAFRPRRREVRSRWISVKYASDKGTIMPPVTLYKVGEVYFVVDGHHRLSVARADGQDYVDAYVTVFDTACACCA